MVFFFTNQHVDSIFGISRKVLYYWRKIGLFSPSKVTSGHHARYTFEDLVAIRTIKSLRDAGISTFVIKQVVAKLKKQYPELTNPLASKSLYVVGKEVNVADRKGSYNPLTGQGTLIENHEMKAWVAAVTLKGYAIPSFHEKRREAS